MCKVMYQWKCSLHGLEVNLWRLCTLTRGSLIVVFCHRIISVLLLHHLATRERCCLQNCSALTVFCCSVSSREAADRRGSAEPLECLSPSVYLLFLLVAAASGRLWLSMLSPVIARLWIGLGAALGAPPSLPLTAALEWMRRPADSPLNTNTSSVHITSCLSFSGYYH